MAPQHVAVLGGGLTGLSAAFHLARRFPSSRITVFEQADRFGGWVRSSRVEVDTTDGSNGNMLLEAGPRTLRPNSKAVLELINLLDLTPSLITTPRTAPAARNRFLYLPEAGLVRLPSSLPSLLASGVGRRLMLPGALTDALRAGNRAAGTEDESVDALLARRFGAEFARVFGSALVHGVYAADARALSVRAAFPSLWDAQLRGAGSVVRGMLAGALRDAWGATSRDGAHGGYDVGTVPDAMRGVSVFSFKDGMETLTSALTRSLVASPNVELRTNSTLSALRFNFQTGTFELEFTNGGDVKEPITHLVSALPTPALGRLLPGLVHLPTPPRATVTLTNLIFPPRGDGSPLHPDGFGYLIPRPKEGYTANSEGVLGVVFDSSSLAAQDRARGYTKLTIMQGGPHPRTDAHGSPDAIMAHLERTLGGGGGGGGAPLPRPVFHRTWRHVDCIPAPPPGHLARASAMRDEVSATFGGRLEVVGAGVSGVSVGDCVEMGRSVGRDWV